MKTTMIRARDVCFRYEDARCCAVNGLSLDIYEGEFLAILGRNGSGKSTFAKMLNALLTPNSGTIAVDGLNVAEENDCFEIRKRCGMVFQNPDNQIVATIVEEDCAFGLENLGVDPEEIRRRVDETLSAVGMEAFAKASPSMLSGGQKQRVAVAGVLAMRPQMIVFDESTAMLDPVGRREVLTLARRLQKENHITVVWITHFMDEVIEADRIAVMDGGRIVLTGSPCEIFSKGEDLCRLGLDVPEMMKLAMTLKEAGLDITPETTMSVAKMTEELCRLKSKT